MVTSRKGRDNDSDVTGCWLGYLSLGTAFWNIHASQRKFLRYNDVRFQQNKDFDDDLRSEPRQEYHHPLTSKQTVLSGGSIVTSSKLIRFLIEKNRYVSIEIFLPCVE